jgi:hypothetical protein
MMQLHLDDHGTDRDTFARLYAQLWERHPELFEVMRTQMRVLIGELKLDADQRAALVRRFRELAPATAEMERIALSLELQLANVAAS